MDSLQLYIAEMKTGSKVGDRRTAAQNLENYLKENLDDVCDFLDINSVVPEKRGNEKMTWTRLFTEMHSYFSKETEKEKGAAANKLTCFSVVNTVFTKATRNRPLLQARKVFDFVVSNLESNRHAILCGPSLVQLLERFLSIDMYKELIDAGAWIDLLKTLIKNYRKHGISSSCILRCLTICITQGSLFSDVIPCLRVRVVNFYRDLLEKDANLLQDYGIEYLNGITSLCQLNACEFRTILCKLGEHVIPSLLSYSHSDYEGQEAALVEFLLVQYALHMPCNVDVHSRAFYAGDLSKWKEALRSMYSYCIDAIEDTANKRHYRYRSEERLSDQFLELAAKCTKQISSQSFSESDISEGEDDDLVPKKKMRYKSFGVIISDISRKQITEGWFNWLKYATAVLNDFPELVETRIEYSTLVNLGCNLFKDVRHTARTEFYNFFASLLNVEKCLRKKGVINESSDTWSSVWDYTIKSIPISGDKPAACALLRQLMQDIRPSNMSNLLSLYLNNSIPAGKYSVQLLADFLSLCAVPVQMKSTTCISDSVIMDEEIAVTTSSRLALIKWLLKATNEDITGYESLLSTVLCSLVVKQSHLLILKELGPSENPNHHFMEFEPTLLEINFVKMPNQSTKGKSTVDSISNSSPIKFIVYEELANRLSQLLQVDLDSLPALQPMSGTLEENGPYQVFICKLKFYMNVFDLMQRHSIGSGGTSSPEQNPRYVLALEKVFSNGMAMCNNFIAQCFDSSNAVRQSPQHIQNLANFTRLLLSDGDRLSDKTRLLLSQKITVQTLDHFKTAFRSNLAKHIEQVNNNFLDGNDRCLIYDDGLPSRLRLIPYPNSAELDIITRKDRSYEAMSIAALRILIDYGLICAEKTSIFDEVVKDLLEENFCSANQFLFDACSEVVVKVAKLFNNQDLQLQNITRSLMGLLQKCCRGFHQLPNCAGRIWEMFKEFTHAVGSSADGTTKQHFMILFGTCYTFLNQNNARPPPRQVYSKAFKALAELAKHDQSLTWTYFKPSNTPQPMWVLEDLHEFIGNKSQLIRMWATDTIRAVYENALPYDYKNGTTSSQHSQDDSQSQSASAGDSYSERRQSFLEMLNTKLLDIFEVPRDSTADEIEDDVITRSSTVLSCLIKLIFAFPYTQRQTVMFLFVIVKVKSIDVGLANRALAYVSPMAVKTICSYLPYILRKGKKLGQKVQVKELPFQLFDCENLQSFVKRFRNEICVELFEQKRTEELELVASQMDIPIEKLVEECYGLIMARAMPSLADIHFQMPNAHNSRLAHYNEVHSRLVETLGGKDKADSLMETYFGDLVLNLISLIFEPDLALTWTFLEVNIPEPVPPHHTKSKIERSLAFLQSIGHHNEVSVIGYLSKSSHENIYKIMLRLAVRIHESHDEPEKFWRLYQFSFFVGLLLKEPPGIFLTMKEYVCNFVFNTYLRLLKAEVGSKEVQLQFRKVVMHLILEVVTKLTEDYPDEMQVFFQPVIQGFVGAVEGSPELIPHCKTALDYLLRTNGDKFAQLIGALDPFPSGIVEFHEYSNIQLEKKYGTRRVAWPLAKELEQLLKQPEYNLSGEFCTKERLKFLRELLANGKRDLERMVKNLEGKRFSEDCDLDPLHNIIQMLVGITISPNRDDELVLEACRCLGEIGPVDLSVLVLPPYKSQGKFRDKDHALIEIIKMITTYLKSDNIRLVTATGKVLRALLRFEECSQLVQNELDERRLGKILLPFCCPFRPQRRTSIEKIDSTKLEHKLGLNEMNEAIDYKTWLTNLTTGLIECFRDTSSYICYMLPICEEKVEFCEVLFPYVVYLVLYAGRTNINVKRTLGGYFRNFFAKFTTNSIGSQEAARSFTPSSFGTTSSTIYLNKLALRSLIRAIQFLRQHPIPQEMKGKVKATPWDSNFWIDIHYLDVARAAQYCGAYLTSILFIEIAATEMEWSSGGAQAMDSRSGVDDTQEEFYSQGVCIRNKSEAMKIEKLLLKAYSSIGEADAVYGCGSARFADVESSMHHMEQTMDWHQLLRLANGSNVSPETCRESQVALSFKQLGMYNVLWDYLKGVEKQGGVIPEDLAQVQYECGWRLTKWDLDSEKLVYIKDVVETSVRNQSPFQMYIYESVQNGLIDDKQSQLKAVQNGLRSVRNELKHATLESSQNIYGFLSRLQMLRVVEDFFEKTGEGEVDAYVKKWKFQDRIQVGDFKYQEPVLCLRNVLLRSYDQAKASANFEGVINESMLEMISKAREAGRLELAESCATAMASLCDKPCLAREFEVAKNNWSMGKADVARDMMNKLIKKCPNDDDLYPSLLLLYGEWLSISHCERPSVILDKYLQKSCTIYESKRSSAPVHDVSKAYIVLAKYADAQYQNVTKYMSSDVFKEKLNVLLKAREQEKKMQNSTDTEKKKSVFISKRQSNYDQEEIAHIQKEQKNFLELALKHYLRGLRTSAENDLLIFRAISLWLENENEVDYITSEDRATKIFGDEKMPSYKYIVVLHQLSARLSKENSARNALLKEILVKCAEDHPYHVLPILLTQASLHKDANLTSKQNMNVPLTARVEAADEIVKSLQKDHKLGPLVKRMITFWEALIKLANVQDRGINDGVKKNISSNTMKELKDLSIVAVPTATIPVLQSGNYKDSVVYIDKFDNVYALVGGINSPKKVKCRGSNGVWYNMLLKGQDDLRQDAVMQQVFGVMNRLLQVEPKTRMRRLHIRTYKVVPLSQRTGMIEWVENTQTLGEYLTGNNQTDHGAHGRYRPNEYKPIECRRMLMEAKAKGLEPEQKFTTYENICENFKPVFRHFFFENFKEAGVFFEKRLAYTRSVATTSIVGYILGLGDRHVLNILIDKSTAEFIHIDLGVAFEQGRVLPTPETVPFRLTRDVVDGMGVSGVEGAFRRSCEMTMEVLRNNAEIIITVLQVLLYDPLYMWALTNDRVAKVQPELNKTSNGRKSTTIEQTGDDSVKERNNSAVRVLLRLRQKLMGIEEEGGATGAISSGCSLSIDGHVALLIQRAMDPDKLCRLFPGWQPYL